MSWREADELALLSVATALALAEGKKAEELTFLAGFVVAVGDILALLAVIVTEEETRQEEKKHKEKDEKLDKRLEKIEERLKELKDCCKAKEEKK